MKARTTLVSIIILLALFTSVPVLAKRVPGCPPTSLEVWKTISCVTKSGDQVTVEGTIYIENVGENWAWCEIIEDSIEAKGTGPGWTEIERVQLAFQDPDYITAPGSIATIDYEITFTLGPYKAYRNVAWVKLDNHPTGERWFKYRLSFDIP